MQCWLNLFYYYYSLSIAVCTKKCTFLLVGFWIKWSCDVLFFSDISEEPLWKIEFNVSAMQFLTAAVNCDSCVLTPDLWDFILCSDVSWIEVRTIKMFYILYWLHNCRFICNGVIVVDFLSLKIERFTVSSESVIVCGLNSAYIIFMCVASCTKIFVHTKDPLCAHWRSLCALKILCQCFKEVW